MICRRNCWISRAACTPQATGNRLCVTGADQQLTNGTTSLLDTAVPVFERIMIETALKHTAGRRRDAANLLGWGRNTLTRKIKELNMDSHGSDDDDESEE